MKFGALWSAGRQGVNDCVVEGTMVGGTMANEDDADEGAAAGCMKEAARGEVAVGGTVMDCSRGEEGEDDDTVGDRRIDKLAPNLRPKAI